MSLLGTKALLASKTFWGVVIAAVSPILQIVGVDVGSLLSDITQNVIQLVGLVIALYGRFHAKETIGGVFSSGITKS